MHQPHRIRNSIAALTLIGLFFIPTNASAAEPRFGPIPRPELKGYCPAAYILHGKAVKGDEKWDARYNGKRYFCSSAEAKEKFLADPEKYLPEFGGLCTVGLGGSYGTRLPGDPEVFDVRDGRVYLFSSERARRSYEKRPEQFIARAEERFARPALEGYCPVSYQTVFQAVGGNKEHSYFYDGQVYHMLDAEALAKFRNDPERYLPQFEGHCVTNLSHGRLVPGDPEYFIVSQNKTYLYADNKAMREFMTRSGNALHEATINWQELKKDE